MSVMRAQLQALLEAKEDEHLECKEAKTTFHFETLVKYCVALANEGGGWMVLGVTDHVPHHVVGQHVARQVADGLPHLHQRPPAVGTQNKRPNPVTESIAPDVFG